MLNEKKHLDLYDANIGNLPVIHLLNIYFEGDIDYFYINDVYGNVSFVLDGTIESIENDISYGKSKDRVVNDCIELTKFLVSSNDFYFAEFDSPDVEMKDSIQFINSDEFRNYVINIDYINDCYDYFLVKRDNGKYLPDVIPDHIKMIFSKNRNK